MARVGSFCQQILYPNQDSKKQSGLLALNDASVASAVLLTFDDVGLDR